MSKKKVTAPKTYNPGKGRPKEHLAYLNAKEMAYLRSINGNNMERGPRGLPSFPPNDALGSSSVTKSGSASKAGTESKSGGGNKSNVGGGGGGGGGNSAGTRGSSTSKVGANSGREAPGNTGTGGQRGAGSNTGPGSARPGTTSKTTNKDQADRQRGAVNDAIAAVKSNAALKTDLQVGGIKTINVGPMQTPVSVSRALTPAKTSISKSISNVRSPMGPSYGPDNIAKLNQMEQEMRNFLSQRDVTPTGNPNMAGAYPTQMPNKNLQGAGYGTFNVPKTAGIGALGQGLPAPRIPDRVTPYGPNIPGIGTDERVLAVDTLPPENVTTIGKTVPKAPTVFTRDYDKLIGQIRGAVSANMPTKSAVATPSATTMPSSVPTAAQIARMQEAAVDALRTVNGVSKFQSPTKSFGEQYDPNADFSESTSIPSYAQGSVRSRTRGIEASPGSIDTVVRGDDGAPIPGTVGPETVVAGRTPEDVWGNTPYGEPGVQQRVKSPAEKVLRKAPGVLGGAVKIGGWLADKVVENMTPEERIAQMDRWNQMNSERLNGAGGDNDRSYRPRFPNLKVSDSTVGTGQMGGGKASSDRPEIYFQWDVGINIPSPGDSTYTMYQKYLAERQAALEANGQV